MLGRSYVRIGAAAFAGLSLAGCTLSFEGDDGRRQVIGLFSAESEVPEGAAIVAGAVRRFTFYGAWFDDTFRGTSLAVGEVEFRVADLKNQWDEAPDAAASAADECENGFDLHWCSIAPPAAGRAGEVVDVSVAGLTVGAGARDQHFGIGYHRKVLLEVTNDNALVAWPAETELKDLLRGSFNG